MIRRTTSVRSFALHRLLSAKSRDIRPYTNRWTRPAISWLFFRLGLALPHIIAGENLNMPILGPTLAKCGAVFIRRSFGGDSMYNTVVKEYIEQLLETGKNSTSLWSSMPVTS